MWTIDEAIERTREAVKTNEEVYETGVNQYGFNIAELYADDTEVIDEVLDRYKEFADNQRQLISWLEKLKTYEEFINQIKGLNDCNTCTIRDCVNRPELGKPVRINCFAWKGKEEIENDTQDD